MARFRFEPGPVPLHHQVYLDVRRGLDDGTWSPGDRLPPERELAEHYGCSLITVRRALTELAREGRIERTRGRGTTVLRPRIERDFESAYSFTDEMERRGLDPATQLIAARPESAGEAVAAGLELEPGAPTIFVERLRLAAGEPLLLEQVHLPAERFPGLLSANLERESLYDVLAQRFGTRIVRARETLEPVLLRAREARLLDQRPRTPALLIEGIASADDDRPVEFSRTFVRGDRTRYYVERTVYRPDRMGAADPRRAVEELRHVNDRDRVGHPSQEEEPTHA